jgi:hypothetical protein
MRPALAGCCGKNPQFFGFVERSAQKKRRQDN